MLEPVGADSLGRIWRVWIETLPGVRTYGLFFKPRGRGRFPLVLAQHGGQGTPEGCSAFFGPSNYNDMTRRVLARGIAVLAPQLMLWDPGRFGPDHENARVDNRLRQTGGSLAALELLRIRTVIDTFASRRDIDAGRIGMVGLWLNDRTHYAWQIWSWPGAANRLLDAEIGALVCPRPLYVEAVQKPAACPSLRDSEAPW